MAPTGYFVPGEGTCFLLPVCFTHCAKCQFCGASPGAAVFLRAGTQLSLAFLGPVLSQLTFKALGSRSC